MPSSGADFEEVISYMGNIYHLASYVIIDVEDLIVPPDMNK